MELPARALLKLSSVMHWLEEQPTGEASLWEVTPAPALTQSEAPG